MGIINSFNYSSVSYGKGIQNNTGKNDVKVGEKQAAKDTETEGSVRKSGSYAGLNPDTIEIGKKSLAQAIEEIKALPRERVTATKEQISQSIKNDKNAIAVQGNLSSRRVADLLMA